MARHLLRLCKDCGIALSLCKIHWQLETMPCISLLEIHSTRTVSLEETHSIYIRICESHEGLIT
jgi:hypothetical protein